MTYINESHTVKKVMKTTVQSTTQTGTNVSAMLGSLADNYADEILCNTSNTLILKNLFKGFFIFQGDCRLTLFNSNFTSIRVIPYFSSNQTTTNIKDMQSGVSSIRDNASVLFEAYPSPATCLSNTVDFTNSITVFGGATANKSSGSPELWFLPIGENQ